MWKWNVVMAAKEEGLKKAKLILRPEKRIWSDVRVLGTNEELNGNRLRKQIE